MFFPEGQIRVFLYGEPVSMRLSYDGLYALARHRLHKDPLSGHLFAFINRRATQIKVLYFDRTGLCVWVLCKAFTYDQGREMSHHRQLAQHTGVQLYFCDPHSPWQRGTNENTNGLLRQYLPKVTDLSQLAQEDLDTIALQMNNRPRKVLGFRSLLEAIAEIMYNIELAKSASVL